MATMNWESVNRQQRLAKWVAQNDLSPKWWEQDHVELSEIEHWVKRQSATIVRKISNNHQKTSLQTILDSLDQAIQKGDEIGMKLFAQQALNEDSLRNSASHEERANLTLLVQMVICLVE
jgi:ribosomal protein S20